MPMGSRVTTLQYQGYKAKKEAVRRILNAGCWMLGADCAGRGVLFAGGWSLNVGP